MNHILLAALGTLVLGGTAGFGMLFNTGFESNDYTANQPLDGQDGWETLLAPDAAVVVRGHATASSGRMAVKCWGGGPLVQTSGLLDGAWEQVVDFDPVTHPAKVRVQADVRLDGPDTGGGPNDDLASANLYARNGVGRSAFFYVSSNGNAYAFANSDQGSAGYRFETPITLGDYNRLAITLDYSTHIATFEVNGNTVGTLPFGGAGEQFRGTLLEFAAWDHPSFDPTLYTGYWDNVLVRANPAGCNH
jgi:hypothetical protein